MKRYAKFSDCRKYRYYLSRIWDNTLPMAIFICFNPSIGDHEKDDKTIKRCIGFVEKQGLGGFYIVNLFAYIATDPKNLKEYDGDRIGSDNDVYIKEKINCSKLIIGAWGNRKHLEKSFFKNRVGTIKALIKSIGKDIKCFEINKTGEPKHPLYTKENSVLINYKRQ